MLFSVSLLTGILILLSQGQCEGLFCEFKGRKRDSEDKRNRSEFNITELFLCCMQARIAHIKTYPHAQ